MSVIKAVEVWIRVDGLYNVLLGATRRVDELCGLRGPGRFIMRKVCLGGLNMKLG